MKHKTRKKKSEEYDLKYNDIPKDDIERLNYLCDKLNINSDIQYNRILKKKDLLLNNMYYKVFKVVLYEEPEGSPRPRVRLVNRSNITNMALSNSNFIHVYSITGAEDNRYMKRLISNEEFKEFSELIYTPCDVDYVTFSKTPSYFNITDTILSEIGIIRPMTKPDWDNIGKKYSDMYNKNVWIDDSCVVRGMVDKYYSILPRVEITLRYLNGLYNKHQYRVISKRTDNQNLKYFDDKGVLVNG